MLHKPSEYSIKLPQGISNKKRDVVLLVDLEKVFDLICLQTL